MLADVCQEIRNWFDRGLPKWYGKISLGDDGSILYNGEEIDLQDGQYFRIVGSAFNDGVYRYPDKTLRSEVFEGSVWAMAVPPAVIALCDEIDDWRKKYDDVVNSPYQSESFGGYSYSRTPTSYGQGATSASGWQSTFASRLNRWRKIL